MSDHLNNSRRYSWHNSNGITQHQPFTVQDKDFDHAGNQIGDQLSKSYVKCRVKAFKRSFYEIKCHDELQSMPVLWWQHEICYTVQYRESNNKESIFTRHKYRVRFHSGKCHDTSWSLFWILHRFITCYIRCRKLPAADWKGRVLWVCESPSNWDTSERGGARWTLLLELQFI